MILIMKVGKRVLCVALCLILCFQLAFLPRSKAVEPLILTAVAAVGVGGLAAAVAAYFKANGVDMTFYNIASGVSAQEAMSKLLTEFLKDTRDGMSLDDYVSSIGLADKVLFKYYKGAISWAAAKVQTVISALGVATIFEPILNWFTGKYSVSNSDTPFFVSDDVSFSFRRSNNMQTSIFPVVPNGVQDLSPGEYYRGKYFNFSSADSGYRIVPSTTGRTYLGTLGSYKISGSRTSSTPPTTYAYVEYFDTDVVSSLPLSTPSPYGNVAVIGIILIPGDGYYFCLYLSMSGSVLPAVRISDYKLNLSDSGISGSVASASQQSDDGNNRFPATSVPDDTQLSIPLEISDAGTVQPVPPSTDTQEEQADAIASAILDSQAINEFELSETPVVEQEEATPTAAPTAVPTTEPTTEPTAVPTGVEPGPIPEEYTPDITEIFPFCIPFDFYLLFDLFSAEPEAPHFIMPFPIPRRITVDSDGNFNGYEYESYTVEIDFRDKPELEAFMEIFRRGELILFAVGLAMVTRKFIRW